MIANRRKAVIVFVVCFVMALVVVGCAKETDPALSGVSSEPVGADTQAVWSPEADCAGCHADVVTASADYSAGAHASRNLDCASCHIADEKLETIHTAGPDGVNYWVTNDSCLSCHSWENITAATADYEKCLDISGNQLNPHAPHPADAKVEEFQCIDCHSGHKADEGVAGCYSCHHSRTLQSCNDCH